MLYFAIIVITVIFDQATKHWIVASMELYQSNVIIPGYFNLVYVTNRGAAFSMFAEVDSPWRHYFFVSIGCFALVALTVIWFRQRRDGLLLCMALGLIAGGALGNLIDRIRLGAVVDFIDVYFGSHHWPAFNVADSAICVGVFVFLLTGFLEDKKTKL